MYIMVVIASPMLNTTLTRVSDKPSTPLIDRARKFCLKNFNFVKKIWKFYLLKMKCKSRINIRWTVLSDSRADAFSVVVSFFRV